MDTEHMIDVTGASLEALIRSVFNLSRPQGLGFIHHREGDITEDEIADILKRGNDRIPVRMDYVRGRSCKFTVWQDGDRRYIRDSWYDHGPDQFDQLLRDVGITKIAAA